MAHLTRRGVLRALRYELCPRFFSDETLTLEQRSRRSSMSRKIANLGHRSALRESVVSEEAHNDTDGTVRRRSRMLPKFLRKDKDEGSQ